MNDICERLRSAVQLRRAARDAISPAIRLPHTDLMLEAANEIARLRHTDAEREALSWFTGGRFPVCPQHLATIRGLMARLS